MQREVLVTTELLVREFGPQYSPAAVLTCVAECDEMLRAAGVRNGLAIALESMVTARLREHVVVQLPEPLSELAAAN
jgi:hypothetical protein